MRANVLAFLLTISLATTAAGDTHRIAVAVEPKQTLTALTLRSGDRLVPVPVRNGFALVPKDLALPWSLNMTRFEASPYASGDLSHARPWTIRELGVLETGAESLALKEEASVVWLLMKSNSEEVLEIETTVKRGLVRVPLPAGTYAGALLSAFAATRVRSGIVIKPGQTTDVAALRMSATVPVSIRVLDHESRKPVAGARVEWDPPEDILNSTLIARLYAKRWTTTTDRNGVAVFPAIGPLPHSVRWRVDTKQYAPAHSTRMQLTDARRTALPDVRLRHAPVVVARVRFPTRDEATLSKSTLVAGEQRDPQSPLFTATGRLKLREGDTEFRFSTYGRKRLWIEDKDGRTIHYTDFDATDPTNLVDLTLNPVDIYGRVTRRGEAMGDVMVTLADPHHARTILAQAQTADSGHYRLTTWQTGMIFVYTIARRGGGPGKRTGYASERLIITGKREAEVNLELPSAGFALEVRDATSGRPVHATVDTRVQYTSGGGTMSMEETDAYGRLELSSFPTGTAKLHIAAKGYRAADVEVTIDDDLPSLTVALEPSVGVSGKVVDARGVPIADALLLGGFPNELDVESFYRATTSSGGDFTFATAPPVNAIIYVIAPGFALGMTRIPSEGTATVVLQPPSMSFVSLRENNKAPEKVFLVMASPGGGTFIPLAVMEELARVSGMTLYQLCGSSVDGDVILPQFLGPGAYELSIARRGGQPFTYQRIGSITTPLRANAVLTIAK